MSSVSVIIPVFNQLEYTRDCVESLLRFKDVDELEILVVDNGSTDGTKEYLSTLASNADIFKILNFESNQGYACANNLAAQSASGELLIFLNNDTVSIGPWLSTLLEPLTNDAAVGVVGARLIYPNWDLINSAGYVYSATVGAFYPIYEMMEPFLPAANKRREYQALLGACVAMRAHEFRALGGFRDIGLEDIDLCLRVKQKNQRILYVPEASLYHFGSVTLHNSDIAQIPPSTTQEFKKAWGATLQADDQQYYDADGYKVEEIRDGRILLDAPEAKSRGLLAIAIIKFRQQQLDQAEAYLREAISIDSTNRVARSELVLLLIEKRQVREALDLSAMLVQEFPTFIPAALCHAQLLAHTGNQSEARDVLKSILETPSLAAFQKRSVNMVAAAIG